MPQTDVFTEFLAEFKTIVAAAISLPTAAAGQQNILTTVQGQAMSFVEDVRNGEITLPCIVIDAGNTTEDPGTALNNIGDARWPVAVTVVRALAGIGTDGVQNSQNGAFLNILQIKRAIDVIGDPFQTFYPMEEGKIISSMDSPVNEHLLAESNVMMVAAQIQWLPGLMVYLSTS